MKKILPLLCGTAIILTGCGSKAKTSQPAEFDKNFCRNAVITQNEKEYSAQLKRGGESAWEVTFSAPETIKGMVVTCSGDTVNLDFMGLSYAMDRDKMPKYGTVALLTSALETVIDGKDVSCIKDGNKLIEKGVVNGQDFTAEFEGKNLKKMEISKSIKAEFS